jgi:uncharacterized protein HemX
MSAKGRLIVLIVVAVLLGGIYYFTRPAPSREEVRLKMWEQDSKACDRFASERHKARELLAYNPEASLKSLDEQMAESEANLSGLDEKLKRDMALWEADVKACLRGRFWPNESIEELTAKDHARRIAEANAHAKKRGTR